MNVYVACAQNSFYHFWTVVTCATFDLLAVAALLASSNMTTVDKIRDETVIAVQGDDSLSRLHILHCHDGIVHQSIIKSINGSTYALCSKVCVK